MNRLITDFVEGGLEGMRGWSRGRHWPLRLLMWLWMASLALSYSRDPGCTTLIDGLNLGVHELGHLLCSPLGMFFTVLGGSLVQCLVPLTSFVMFHRQEDYFAFAFAFVWLGTNLHSVARYIADARAMQLDLVSPFGGGDGEVIHDWNWILGKLNCLGHDQAIASGLRGLAIACLWTGLAWGAYVLWCMIRERDVPREAARRGPW